MRLARRITLEINRLISIKIVALFHSMKEFQDVYTHTHTLFTKLTSDLSDEEI